MSGWTEILAEAAQAVRDARQRYLAALARRDAVIRGAHRRVPVIAMASLVGLGRDAIYKIIGRDGPVRVAPERDLRSAAKQVATDDGDYITAVARRDEAVRAAAEAGITRNAIAQATGLAPDVVGAVLAGKLPPKPSSRPGRAGTGSVEAERRARNQRLAERKAEIRSGLRQPSRHGYVGYDQGCRCDVCVTGRQEYDRSRNSG